MGNFTGFLLTPAAQQALLEKFPPLYPAIKADHITHRFGARDFSGLFQPRTVEVIGMADSSDGLQALVVKVDGAHYRPDGEPYHITWSLDPEKYQSVDSNALIRRALANPSLMVMSPPISIEVVPVLVAKHEDGRKIIHPLPFPQVPFPPYSPC